MSAKCIIIIIDVYSQPKKHSMSTQMKHKLPEKTIHKRSRTSLSLEIALDDLVTDNILAYLPLHDKLPFALTNRSIYDIAQLNEPIRALQKISKLVSTTGEQMAGLVVSFANAKTRICAVTKSKKKSAIASGLNQCGITLITLNNVDGTLRFGSAVFRVGEALVTVNYFNDYMVETHTLQIIKHDTNSEASSVVYSNESPDREIILDIFTQMLKTVNMTEAKEFISPILALTGFDIAINTKSGNDPINTSISESSTEGFTSMIIDIETISNMYSDSVWFQISNNILYHANKQHNQWAKCHVVQMITTNEKHKLCALLDQITELKGECNIYNTTADLVHCELSSTFILKTATTSYHLHWILYMEKK
jgi:nitrogen regulatory protein PII